MSNETAENIELAIKAHVKSVAEEIGDDSSPVVIDWVVGYTISGLIQIDEGETTVAYGNSCISADTNPNGQVTLATWVAETIMDMLRNYE